MAFVNPPVAFNKHNVDNVVQDQGVYVLYSGDQIIYIGRAAGETTTIRSRLQDHWAGREGVCTSRATHFSYEVCTFPVSREVDLLNWYKSKHGGLPSCNSRVG